MMSDERDRPSPWADAALAAALFAVDPAGTGGVVLRGLPGPVRDGWLTTLRRSLPASTPFRRVPLHATDGRLLGGLDLAATLQAGRPVAERGILADADGGVVLLAMAERLDPGAAARLGLVLDAGQVALERDGLTTRFPTRFGVVALDEGIAPEEHPPAALRDRLAFHIDLNAIGPAEGLDVSVDPDSVAAARTRLPSVEVSDEIVEALCVAAATLGIASLRAPLLALRVARAAAAYLGEREVSARAAALAARLVLAPRAQSLPAEQAPADQRDAESESPPEPQTESTTADGDFEHEPEIPEGAVAESVLAAAQAAIPEGLLAGLRLADAARARSRASGRADVRRPSVQRGRPIGVRRGDLGRGARLNLVETLRSAAPWQRLRRAEAERARVQMARRPRVEVRREDFRIGRFKQRTEVTTIFVVDASGSTALQRLAEAKGAVELLLSECYVRRDRVALVAFRGREAELLLSPTRSLVRAKRSLARLPGGGGTPLAAAIETATQLARSVQRAGSTPLLVFLTDGRANIARDGTAGRENAERDAHAAARILRASPIGALLVDTSPRPQAAAQQLAREMDARYAPLPHAGSAALRDVVRQAEAALPRGAPGSP